MMNLYQIDNEILSCLTVDEETGEVDVNEERLEALRLEWDDKVESIALWIKNLAAEAEAIKREKQALAERQSATERKVERLKQYLAGALGGRRFTSPKVALSYRKSEAVELNEDLFFGLACNEKFYRHKVEADKGKIKEALKEGEFVIGASLVARETLQIK